MRVKKLTGDKLIGDYRLKSKLETPMELFMICCEAWGQGLSGFRQFAKVTCRIPNTELYFVVIDSPYTFLLFTVTTNPLMDRMVKLKLRKLKEDREIFHYANSINCYWSDIMQAYDPDLNAPVEVDNLSDIIEECYENQLFGD